jgi:hypothetical protein
MWVYRHDTEERKLQLAQLLSLAPTIYGAQLTMLKEIDRNYDHAEFGSLNIHSMEYLLSLEEMLRRSKEFQSYLDNSHQSNSTKIFNSESDSLFPSNLLLKDSPCDSWMGFAELCVEILEGSIDRFAPQRSDLVRVCFLIARLINTTVTSESTYDTRERILQRVIHLLRNTYEKSECVDAAAFKLIEFLEKSLLKSRLGKDGALHVAVETPRKVPKVTSDDDSGSLVNDPGKLENKSRPKRTRIRGASSPRRASSRTASNNRPSRRPRPHQSQFVG